MLLKANLSISASSTSRTCRKTCNGAQLSSISEGVAKCRIRLASIREKAAPKHNGRRGDESDATRHTKAAHAFLFAMTLKTAMYGWRSLQCVQLCTYEYSLLPIQYLHSLLRTGVTMRPNIRLLSICSEAVASCTRPGLSPPTANVQKLYRLLEDVADVHCYSWYIALCMRVPWSWASSHESSAEINWCIPSAYRYSRTHCGSLR